MDNGCEECAARAIAARAAQAQADAELDSLVRHLTVIAVLAVLIWAWQSGVIQRVGQILKEV